ncbi:MAG: phosphatidylserine/phosphatidylglycerophosphate/cardiolipin synthase family protein, partial [Bdellovibrionia bacterium]
LKERKKEVPGFELKVIQGWVSPFLSDGGGKTKKELKAIADEYLAWNSPFWLRRFSFGFFRGHVHDKFLIADGRRMILGGMNISDLDAEGGLTAKGSHDVDVLIDGPAVKQATEIFLKLNLLGHYLDSPAHFPPFEREEIQALQSYFYENQEDHDFWTVDTDPNPKPPFRKINRVHIPIRSVLSNPRYFPEVESGDTSLRLIYDNPLIDRDPKTKKQYSKYFRTLKFVTSKAKRTLWVTTPYMTIDREIMAYFVESAKTLDVRIVTNSLDSTDMTGPFYLAQLSHYPELIKAGVKVYEWQGHAQLKRLQKDCEIGSWPGDLLHSKLVIVDGAVSFVGSNNINNRSKNLNNEVMALVNDSAFSRRLEPYFTRLLNGETQSVKCREGTRALPLAEEMTLERSMALWKTLGVKKPIWKYPHGGY